MTTKAESEGPGRGEITRLLEVTREGDPDAEGELLSRVYHELRALAASKMSEPLAGEATNEKPSVEDGAGQKFQMNR